MAYYFDDAIGTAIASSALLAQKVESIKAPPNVTRHALTPTLLRGRQIWSRRNGNGKINSFASRLAPTVDIGSAYGF
ncbi:hypothetical protein EMIT0P253_400027 [Pseudomonas sp. IT-P253]|jgi:hypothetical protein